MARGGKPLGTSLLDKREDANGFVDGHQTALEMHENECG